MYLMKEFQLIVEETNKTPEINLNLRTGELLFSGKSIPENAAKVYEPVLNWVSDYIQHARPTTNVRINLEYFNTASSIWIAKIIKELIKIKEPDYVLIIHLYVPLEDYNEMKEFDDVKEAFAPVTDILQGAVISTGIKLYGMDDDGKVVKDTLLFI
jgi:hypothetical protein